MKKLSVCKSMKKLIFLSFCFCFVNAVAQKINENASFRALQTPSYFKFNYDNDYYANRDRDYTQGYSFTLSKPWLSKNPVNHLFFKLENTTNSYGLTLEHIGFTPDDYVSEDIQFNDRPFSAAIYLKSFKTETHLEKKYRLTSTFSFGIIGPGAFGKEMQVGIHKLTGNKIPMGWKNQIKNDVVLSYELSFEKQLIKLKDVASVEGFSTLQLGSLFTNVSAGTTITVGLINDVYKPLEEQKGFKIYAFFQPKITAIAYDATLQGGLINKKSPYTIPTNDIEHFTAQHNFGVVLQTNGFYLEYSRVVLSKQFETDGVSKWGGVKLGFKI